MRNRTVTLRRRLRVCNACAERCEQKASDQSCHIGAHDVNVVEKRAPRLEASISRNRIPVLRYTIESRADVLLRIQRGGAADRRMEGSAASPDVGSRR